MNRIIVRGLPLLAAVLLAGVAAAAKPLETVTIADGWQVQVNDNFSHVISGGGRVLVSMEPLRPYINGKWVYFQDGQVPAEVKVTGGAGAVRRIEIQRDSEYASRLSEVITAGSGEAAFNCFVEYEPGLGPIFLGCMRIPLASLGDGKCVATDFSGKVTRLEWKAGEVPAFKAMELRSLAFQVDGKCLTLDLSQPRGRTANGRNVWKLTGVNQDYIYFECMGNADGSSPDVPSIAVRVQVQDGGLESVDNDTEGITATAKELSNPLLEVGFFNHSNLIWRLHYKPDDLDFIRFRVPPKGYFPGLLLSGWNWLSEGTKRDSRLLPNGQSYTVDKDNRRLQTTVTMKPNRAAVDFLVRLDNNGADTPLKDRYFYDVAIVPGGLEKEYNPGAWLFAPQEDGTVNGVELMKQFGELRIEPTRNFVALVDACSKHAFVQCVTAGDLSYFTVKVGRRDTHGSRDLGRRCAVGAIFDRVRLSRGDSAEYRYHWTLLKGLQSLHAYRDGLGAGVVEQGAVWKGMNQTVLVDFAAAGDGVRTVRCRLEVLDSQQRSVAAAEQEFRLELRHGQAQRRELPVDLPAQCAWPLEARLVFLEEGEEIGAWKQLFSNCGETMAETASEIRRLRGELEAGVAELPYLGAEFPASLAGAAEVDFLLGKADDAIGRACPAEAVEWRAQAAAALERLREAVGKERLRPQPLPLRRMADRVPGDFCHLDASEIYAPDGCRLFLWGGLLQFKVSGFHTDQWIENYVRMAKGFGNMVSIYLISSWNENDPKHLEMLQCSQRLLRRMQEEGIYVTVHCLPMYRDIEGYAAEDKSGGINFIPECQQRHAAAWRHAAKTNAQLGANVPFVPVFSIEPDMPRPDSKLNQKAWNEFLAARYGSMAAARAHFGLPAGDAPVEIPANASDEGAFSPLGRDYGDYLSGQLGQHMEDAMRMLDEAGSRQPRILGASIFSSWPTHPAQYLTKYINDPRISGACVDKYEGFWWGAVKSPPEIWWSECQIFGEKPILLTEWGAGCGMDIRAAWHHADYALDQAWGKYFAGLKVRTCIAWDLIPEEFCGLFTTDAQPKGVTARLMRLKDELIANPIPKRLQVLVLASRHENKLSTYIAAMRLLSLMPQLGIDFTFATFDDLPNCDLSKYKLAVCYTEGMPESAIAPMQQFGGKVLLLGRPMLDPLHDATAVWARHGLFLKEAGVARGPGGVVERQLTFAKDFGGHSAGSRIGHSFAETESMAASRSSLLPEVEVILADGNDAMLMRQGNCYWWTDMLGYFSADFPEGEAVAFPELRPLERSIVTAVCDAAGVAYRDSPVQVWASNDVAFTYDVQSGHVRVFNPGTVQVPAGRFLKHYERFSDGIVCRIAGTPEPDAAKSALLLRCPAARVQKCLLDGKEAVWRRQDDRHVAVELPPKNGDYAIQVFLAPLN